MHSSNGNIETNKSTHTSASHVSVFNNTVQKSQSWISEIREDLNWLDADGAYHLLRATLQTLRDQLSIDEAAQFAAQLPLILRGTFYECWNPTNRRRAISKQEFLDSVLANLNPKRSTNFNLEDGVSIALKVILNHISPGEIEDIIVTLKPSLKLFMEKSFQNQELANA